MRLRSDPVVRLRALVLAAYCVNGFCLSAWNVRLAAIGEQTGLDAAGLGRFLMAGAIGTLVTIPVAGRWVARAGSRRVYGLATVGFVVAYLALAAAIALGAVWPLLAANALHGAAFALTNVPQSVLGTQAERRVGRSILSQFHAAYSIAAALGAALGGLAATAGLGPAPQLLALAVLAGAARTAVWSGLRGAGTLDPLPARPVPPSGPDEEPTPRGRRTGVWLETSTLLLGTVVFGAALSEGAANNWITPTLIDAFPVDEGTAATAVSVFLVAQTLGRIAGGRLVDRFGATVALVTLRARLDGRGRPVRRGARAVAVLGRRRGLGPGSGAVRARRDLGRGAGRGRTDPDRRGHLAQLARQHRRAAAHRRRGRRRGPAMGRRRRGRRAARRGGRGAVRRSRPPPSDRAGARRASTGRRRRLTASAPTRHTRRHAPPDG